MQKGKINITIFVMIVRHAGMKRLNLLRLVLMARLTRRNRNPLFLLTPGISYNMMFS